MVHFYIGDAPSSSNSTVDTNNNIHAPTTPLNHLFIKDKKTNHFKDTTINKYFNCIASPKHTSTPTVSIPSETEHKIAYGNLDKIIILTTICQSLL